MMNNRYSIDVVFGMLGEQCLNIQSMSNSPKESITVDGYQVYKRSLRYATFYQKGCKCVRCGKEGAYFQLDEGDEKSNNVPSNRRHFNLYAADGTLITKDHILPKKWGGKDTVDNLQPMCQDCNVAKGSIYDGEINGITATHVDNPEKMKKYVTIEDAIYDIVNRNHILSQGGKPGIIAKKSIHVATKIMFALDKDLSAYGYYWKHQSFKVEGTPYDKQR